MSKSVQNSWMPLEPHLLDRLRERLAKNELSDSDAVWAALRAEATRLASRLSVEQWLDCTRQRSSDLDRAQVLDALDEQRGAWPDARR